MANTTNFGWETPDDTDLVKDGAAAMRTLGQAIDTSLVDLKGGTTGQNLRKNSNTDMDFTWAGDATNTVIDAAGDLLYGTAADTLGKLAIGTAGQVLKVNSGATAPEWGSISTTPSFIGARAYDTGATSIANNTWTAILFAGENFDTDGFHSTSTNTSRMTIPSGKDGKYLVTGNASLGTNSTTGSRHIAFYKNGSRLNPTISAVGPYASLQITTILDLVATDYIEIYFFQSTGNTHNTESDWQSFAIQYLGA